MAGQDTEIADKKRNKRALTLIATCGLITLAVGVFLISYAYLNYRYERKATALETPQTVTITKGSGLSSIASQLEREGLIDSAFFFKAVTKLRGNEAKFKAGEFALSAEEGTKLSMADIYGGLVNGKAVLYPFTAAEGLTSAQIMRKLAALETLTGDVPETPAEGSLLPETYMTPRGMKRADVVAKMKAAQTQLLDELWDGRQENLPIKTKREAIILASVVEKETGIGSERDMVAGVFINRLRKSMRLQSDPTIIYGVSKGEPLRNRAGKRRGIRRSEIDRKTDWNTYQIDGLPKTPICNPGREAIAAVLQPADTKMLFFVADGTGGHVFAQSNREHINNVKKWRKIEAAKKRAN